ncbi:MAG TPA: PLP-dependent transferase [Thermoanaerobaculia bacterium]|nr:PLP-dependent transferase [Thermoanaerobaculia bacterium]
MDRDPQPLFATAAPALADPGFDLSFELDADPAIAALATTALHAGRVPDPVTGALLPPIYQTTTFVQKKVGEHLGYTYSRSGNPTVSALERRLAALEGGAHALCFSTGLAATVALALGLLRAGDRVVLSAVVYGGTYRLFRDLLAGFGVVTDTVDSSDNEALARTLATPARLLLVESPANPTLRLTDLARAAELGHAAGAVVVVDNTLLTPVLQRPLELGADIVLHSTTKFIEGHNATVGGALILDDAALAERLGWTRNAIGAIQSPWNAWLTLQGVKTLPLRITRHGANALTVARFLAGHPQVVRLLYPGLASFPQAELARRQQRGGGALIAFEVEGGAAAGARLMAALRLCSLAENLGAAETLVTHPVSMTHAAVPQAEREAAGITDGLVRLSVGLEDPQDLIADLAQALAACAFEPAPSDALATGEPARSAAVGSEP